MGFGNPPTIYQEKGQGKYGGNRTCIHGRSRERYIEVVSKSSSCMQEPRDQTSSVLASRSGISSTVFRPSRISSAVSLSPV